MDRTEVPDNLTVKAGWDKVEQKMHVNTASDINKVFALRSAFYSGATHMLTIMLEAADVCETDEDQDEYLTAVRTEISTNARVELGKLGITEQIMETVLWETERKLDKHR